MVKDRIAGAACAAAAIFALSGCTGGMSAAVDSLKQVAPRGAPSDSSPLDPKFAYLRVTRGSHVGLLWRGNIERTPHGPVEVYYSSSGEVLRLHNGRIVGALGLTTEWRRVEGTPPSWDLVARTPEPQRFVRVRDVMPGYRTGVRDELVVRRVPPPSRSAITGIDPHTLTWFEESTVMPNDQPVWSRRGGGEGLPPARYAVSFSGDGENVIYSEQCLSHDFCFSWQRWSAALQQATLRSRTE